MNTSALNPTPSALQRWQALWQLMAHRWSGSPADRRLWQAACADHRVMADCVQAAQRDLDDSAGLAQSWGRFPEHMQDGRGQATHLRHP